jgi:hypothetical protein
MPFCLYEKSDVPRVSDITKGGEPDVPAVSALVTTTIEDA